MIFDGFSIQILREWPESIQVNFITESCGKCIHEETCAGSFDGNFVCQPVTGKEKNTHRKEFRETYNIPYGKVYTMWYGSKIKFEKYHYE